MNALSNCFSDKLLLLLQYFPCLIIYPIRSLTLVFSLCDASNIESVEDDDNACLGIKSATIYPSSAIFFVLLPFLAQECVSSFSAQKNIWTFLCVSDRFLSFQIVVFLDRFLCFKLFYFVISSICILFLSSKNMLEIFCIILFRLCFRFFFQVCFFRSLPHPRNFLSLII
ncbi:hypothetical protein KSP39_PZI008282 [Platanthera zijinensis]|uniref:Uncharacterized protein n=1 Tax=Platanthera zijinensis TaxID=2320716 RepID=A0AAP0BPK5_9ASPA